MAYTVMTEAQGAAREYWKDGQTKIRDCLRDNKAVILSGTDAVASNNDIVFGLEQNMIDFPAIRVVAMSRADNDATMSGSSGARMLTLRYRVYGFDYILGSYQDLSDDVGQLADRFMAVLEYNTTLDGWAHDLNFGNAEMGKFDVGNRKGFVFGSQVDVIVEKWVARP